MQDRGIMLSELFFGVKPENRNQRNNSGDHENLATEEFGEPNQKQARIGRRDGPSW
jgi:hypothetical protein